MVSEELPDGVVDVEVLLELDDIMTARGYPRPSRLLSQIGYNFDFHCR